MGYPKNLAVLVFLGAIFGNFASLAPPYTCTTTTTLCQPGDGTPATPKHDTNLSVSQGKPGKRGPTGLTGEKGEKGEPCSCNIADEELVNAVRRKMEKIESDYAQLMHRVSSAGIGSATNPGKSCLHLKNEGKNVSGIYFIKAGLASAMIQVFCDMESAGGGWTLVASVHENNIEGKCTSGDLWSSDQNRAGSDDKGSGNWENFNTFGNPEAATSADYKSQAYYELPASDVMIWHVPNDVKISQASEEASIKYYTNNAFLENYGGHLRTLFSDHYPLTTGSQSSSSRPLSDLMMSLRRSSPAMVSSVPGFYLYNYDQAETTNNFISDGGDDMFDTGNKIFYSIGSESETWITYGESYVNASHGVEFISSAAQHPFHALMSIGNNRRNQQSYAIRSFGDAGADGGGSYVTRSGHLTRGALRLDYHAYSIHGAEDPSICEVFYWVTSDEWGSSAPSVQRSPWNSGTAALNHGLVFGGAPKSLLVGYTLLSRSSANEVSESYIRSVLSIILSGVPDEIATFDCGSSNQSLTQPVMYLKGNDEQISNRIPPSVRSKTTPGFIQFRPYNQRGFPNAICPGVKTTSCYPESLCVGGINTMSRDASVCGDFAGWQGQSGDSPTKTQPSGSAKSLDDVNSSILIFTRAQQG